MKKRILLVAMVVLGAVAAGGYYYWTTPPVIPFDADALAMPEGGKLPEPIQIEYGPVNDAGFASWIKVFDERGTYDTVYMGKLLRTKGPRFLPIRLYEIAAYTVDPKPASVDALLGDLLVDGKPKVYVIKFIAGLPGRAILSDIYNEIDATFTDVDMDRLRSNIDKFVQQFARGSKRGDLIYILWLPGGRVYSSFDAPEKVEFIGQDVPLARAIWRIWAGPQSGPERVTLVDRFARSAIANNPGSAKR